MIKPNANDAGVPVKRTNIVSEKICIVPVGPYQIS